jgi:hypothetical protein
MAKTRGGVRNIVTFSRLGLHGRFANQLYQIAGTIGIARKNGFDFAFPEWKNHDGLNFESGIDIDVQKYFVNPLPLYDGPPLPEQFVPWGYHDMQLTESTDLTGHMQSERYFSHCVDEIKRYFRMKEEPRQNDYVAIHFRGKDYGSDYHPRVSVSYYEQAIALFPSARFLAFSDEIDTARQIFGDRAEYANGDYLSDFRRIKTCRHFIIANSSYSAMAAVLGEAPDKRVVAPRPWFGKSATITGEDIYSDDWVVINW